MSALHRRAIDRRIIHRAVAPVAIEMLESRQLLSSVALTGSGAFTISLSSGMYSFTGGTSTPSPIAAVGFIGFTFTGGGANDSLTIISGNPTLLNDAGADGTSLAVTVDSSAAINFDTTEHLSSLAIDAGATARMLSNGHQVLVTNSLSLAGSTGAWTGTLDLGNNDLIVHGGSLLTTGDQVKSGFNATGANWNGTGIDSSAAAGNPSHLTALGAIANQDGTSAYLTSFDGQMVTNSDILVKYTYYGDATLDGKVDGSDYSRIDSGYLMGATGWFNGDFNYDGAINGSDYTLIDNAFNTQGAQINGAGSGTGLPTDATVFNGSSSSGSSGGTAGDVAAGADGGSPAAMSFSGAVNYADGSVTLDTSDDLTSAEAGIISGHSRTWTDQPGLVTNSTNGNNTVVSQWPSLSQQSSGAILAINGASTKWFDNNRGTYTEQFYGQDTLVSDGSGGYLLTDSTGNKFDYYGFSVASALQGQIKSLTDPGGNVTNFIYYGSSFSTPNLLQYVNRTRVSDGATLEQLNYNYSSTGVGGALQLATVTMSRLKNGSLSQVQSAAYQYYGGSNGTTFGRVGDLELATVSENGVAVDHKLYRYDTSSGLLLYALEDDAYERMAGSGNDPLTSMLIGQYANQAFTYYSNGKVATQSLEGGTYTYHYNYLEDTGGTDATNLNTYRYKTVETLPDGNENTVYSNTAGEVVLKIFTDAADPGNTALGGLQWANAYQYDSQGRLVLSADPSGVSTSGGQPVLADVSATSATSWFLNSSTGLETLLSYYSTTGGGAAAGYLENTYLRQGYSGTSVEQSTDTYDVQTGTDGTTIYPVASDTVYRNTGGSGAETTNFNYSFGSTVQPLSVTTTYPANTTAENGPGASDTETQYTDPFGRTTWTQDGDGFLTYTAYDDATGAAIKTISDVNTSDTGDFSNLPSGLSTPTGGGLELVRTMAVDGLGRTTSSTDPMGHVTHIFYVDTAAVREVIATPPTVSSGNSAPIQVVRDDRAAGNTYTFTVMATGGSTLESLSLASVDKTGQTISSDRYFNVSAGNYTPPSGASSGGDGSTAGSLSVPGTSNTRYRTVFGYDIDGRQYSVAQDTAPTNSSSGTLTAPQVTITAYDSLGRVASTWTGTDGSGWASPQSAGTNMVQITADQYDNNGVGDSDLTQTTQFPGDGSPNRVTQAVYDFRDREVLSEQGVGAVVGTHPPITSTAYDNLNEVTDVRTYDGEGVTFSSLDPATVDTTLSSARRAYTQTFYDEQGRVYHTLLHSIDQTSGTDNGSLATDTWYDHRGNVIKNKVPNGLVTKTRYDGAGRVVETSSTDGGSVTAWSDAGNLTNDHVLEQQLNVYDADGNIIFAIDKQRNFSYLGTGELITTLDSASGFDQARISFVGNWYDEDDRLITTVNYGNNGDDGVTFFASGSTDNNTYTRPTTPPTRYTGTDAFDPYLRTDYFYDNAGQVGQVQYPRTLSDSNPRTDKYFYDALNRQIVVLQSATASATIDTVPNSSDRNLRITYRYSGLDQIVEQDQYTYDLDSSGTLQQQVEKTTYSYGVLKNVGTYLNSNALLYSTFSTRTTNTSSGTPTTVTLSLETFGGYDALGENTQDGKANHSVHQYNYDVLGRKVSDVVTNVSSLPSTMDTRVGELDYAYDTLDRTVLSTSRAPQPSAGTQGAILNQVQDQYDGLGNLIKEYQENNGAVNTSSSVVVQYNYDTNFSSNYSRLNYTLYPNGRAEWVIYNDSGNVDASLDNSISRPDAQADSTYNTTTGAIIGPSSTDVEAMTYLGLSTYVIRDLKKAATGVSGSGLYTMGYLSIGADHGGIDLNPQKSNEAGTHDPYKGLDRFGRVISYGWGILDVRTYAYDADGNELYAYAGTNVNAKWRSELFESATESASGTIANLVYDGLGRAEGYQRGVAVADGGGRFTSVTTASISGVETHYREQTFASNNTSSGTYKLVANTDGHVDSDYPGGRRIYQSAIPSPSTTVITSPTSPSTDLFLQYDAWGRLTEQGTATSVSATNGVNYPVTSSFPSDTQVFSYDAMGRRIEEDHSYSTDGTTQNFQGINHLYYNSAGNVIEEDLQSNRSSPAMTIEGQYVPSLAGGNMLVLEDENTGHSTSGNNFGKPNSALDDRIWIQQGPDASTWQIIHDTASMGNKITEQYLYTPQGQVTVLDFTASAYTSPNGNKQPTYTTSNFRYLFKGERAEIYANPDTTTRGIVNMFDGLYSTSSGEYDGYAGTPVGEDFQAYDSPNDISSDVYNPYVNQSVNYVGDGTSGQWINPSTSLGYWTNVALALPGATWSTVSGIGTEISYRAADFANDALYDYTFLNSYINSGFDLANTQGISLYKGSLSQMGQLLDSGQTTWARATFSSVPVIGSGYNVITGTDLLTGRQLTGLNYGGAVAGLVADLAFTGAAGLNFAGIDYNVGALAQQAGVYAGGFWEGLGAGGKSVYTPSILGGFEGAAENLRIANRYGKLAIQDALEAGELSEVSPRAAGTTSGGRSYAGRQARLRALAKDPDISSAYRGWITQELNAIARGSRTSIRVPPGTQLAHWRGFEASKGYNYSFTNLQETGLHAIQTKFAGY